jgi:hypothetical protein
LEKSEARIDGAMTRGRDANWADMCALPKTLLNVLMAFGYHAPALRAMRTNQHGIGRKILPLRHQLPGAKAMSGAGNPYFIGFFELARPLLILML